MANTIVMPQLGYDMREGRIVKWLKHKGDEVTPDDEVVEIETDKAVVSVTAMASGVLRRILAEEGAMVPVGDAIGVVAEANEPIPEALAQLAQRPIPTSDAQAIPEDLPAEAPLRPTPAPATAVAAPAGRVLASPLARRVAGEQGIDISQVPGTGPNGRITERDVMAYAAAAKIGAAPAAGATQRMELTRTRLAIARITARSMQEAPHFYVTSQVNMTEAMHLREELNTTLKQRKVRISVNDFIIKACALALARHPTVNGSFQENGLEIHSSINIGIAVDLEERGLMIPTLAGCESRSLIDISAGSRDLVERAKGNRLHAKELSGSTFSISNMGTLDVDSFTGIIFQPNSAILAVGSVKEKPVVQNGQIVVAQTMKMTLSVDHRMTDGAGAARFMRDVKRYLEYPSGLLEKVPD